MECAGEDVQMVWPSKGAAGTLDGWGPEPHELAELAKMQNFWPKYLDGLSEVHSPESYSYDF